jgi:serum/glucocorticoid-regulated kinase 2
MDEKVNRFDTFFSYRVDMSKIDNKMMSAPYKPDPLKYNFDEYEFNKGNDAFLLKFYKNTTRDNNKVKL